MAFAWTGPDGFTSSNEDLSGLAAGEYSLTVTDAKGCSAVFAPLAEVTEPPKLDLSLTATGVTCNGDANGTITVTASGGTMPYEYSRNGITYQGADVFTGLIKNTYTIFVRDAGLCKVSDTISVTEPNELQVASELRIDNNKCFGDSLGEIRILSVVGGAGPYTYSIDNGNTYFNTAIFQNLGAGSYQTVVKDASGCLAMGNNNLINQPSRIRITNYAQVDITGCYESANGKIALEATGGTGVKKYSLDGSGSNLTGIFNNVMGGDHVITITDANSCVRDTVVILDRPDPIILTSVTLTDIEGCNGGTNGAVELTASGGTGALQYAIDGGAFGATTQFNALAAGDHILSVKDAANCQKDTTVHLSEPQAITISSITPANITCSGYDDGSVTVAASGGTAPYSFTLNPGSTANNTGAFTGLVPGTYTVEVDDSQGCGLVVSDSVVITEPAVVSIDSVLTDTILCAGDDDARIRIFAKGGASPYQYSIDDEATYNASNDFAGLIPGTYYLSLEDANGCKKYIDTISFDEPAPLTIVSQAVTDVNTCSGDSAGSITYELTGGTGAVEYSLDGTGWQSDGLFENLPGGDYTILTRDAVGCSKNSR